MTLLVLKPKKNISKTIVKPNKAISKANKIISKNIQKKEPKGQSSLCERKINLTFQDLPRDLIGKILSYLPPYALIDRPPHFNIIKKRIEKYEQSFYAKSLEDHALEYFNSQYFCDVWNYKKSVCHRFSENTIQQMKIYVENKNIKDENYIKYDLPRFHNKITASFNFYTDVKHRLIGICTKKWYLVKELQNMEDDFNKFLTNENDKHSDMLKRRELIRRELKRANQ